MHTTCCPRLLFPDMQKQIDPIAAPPPQKKSSLHPPLKLDLHLICDVPIAEKAGGMLVKP